MRTSRSIRCRRGRLSTMRPAGRRRRDRRHADRRRRNRCDAPAHAAGRSREGSPRCKVDSDRSASASLTPLRSRPVRSVPRAVTYDQSPPSTRSGRSTAPERSLPVSLQPSKVASRSTAAVNVHRKNAEPTWLLLDNRAWEKSHSSNTTPRVRNSTRSACSYRPPTNRTPTTSSAPNSSNSAADRSTGSDALIPTTPIAAVCGSGTGSAR